SATRESARGTGRRRPLTVRMLTSARLSSSLQLRASSDSKQVSRAAGPALLPQHKIDRDLGLYLYWFAAQEVWPIAPLAHRINGSTKQHRMPVDHAQLLNRATAINDCAEHHRALDVRCNRNRRIYRPDFVQKKSARYS